MNWWFMVQWVEIVVITKMAAYTVGKDTMVLGEHTDDLSQPPRGRPAFLAGEDTAREGVSISLLRACPLHPLDKAPVFIFMVVPQKWRWLPALSAPQLPSPEQVEAWWGQQSHAQEPAPCTALLGRPCLSLFPETA